MKNQPQIFLVMLFSVVLLSQSFFAKENIDKIWTEERQQIYDLKNEVSLLKEQQEISKQEMQTFEKNLKSLGKYISSTRQYLSELRTAVMIETTLVIGFFLYVTYAPTWAPRTVAYHFITLRS